MSTTNQGLYEELKSKMDQFFLTASPEEIQKSFAGIDAATLLGVPSESSGAWKMSVQEASGPSATVGLYSLAEEMSKTDKFSDFCSANNNTLALAA